jgi:hypothetical protein
MMKKLASVLLAILIISSFAIAQESPKSAVDSVTIEELRDHMFFLASDELQGRNPGEEGYNIAAMYCTTQFRASGLKPIVENPFGLKSFLQTVPFKRTSMKEKSNLTIINGETSTDFNFGTDFSMMNTGAVTVLNVEGAEFVFAGYGITSKDDGWDDYEGLDVEGKYVIILGGQPMKDGEPILPPEVGDQFDDPQAGMMKKMMNAISHKAAAIILAPMVIDEKMSWADLIGMMAQSSMKLDEGEEEKAGPSFGAMMTPSVLLAGENVINAMMAGTAYNPITGEGEYATFAIEGKTLNLLSKPTVDRVTSDNIVGLVEGTDPELKNEYIVLGAHLDHVGVGVNGVVNGADDNASGSSAILEIAEALAMTPTRRSVIFVLYTAEEKGLIGSQYFVDNSPVPLENIVAHINLDMVGRDDTDFPEGFHALGSSRLSAEYKEIILAVNEKGDNVPLSFELDKNDPQNFFRRSDQFSFHKKGIPVVFFTSGDHPDYHTPRDDAEKISFEKLQAISRLCYDITIEVGNRDEKPKLNSADM